LADGNSRQLCLHLNSEPAVQEMPCFTGYVGSRSGVLASDRFAPTSPTTAASTGPARSSCTFAAIFGYRKSRKQDGVYRTLTIVPREPSTGELKFFVSNAAAGCALEWLLHVAYSHWPIAATRGCVLSVIVKAPGTFAASPLRVHGEEVGRAASNSFPRSGSFSRITSHTRSASRS
jgi:hypothetical protein